MIPELFGTPSDFLVEGVVFPAWQLLKAQIQEQGVAEHLAFVTPRKDNQYVVYTCQDETCLWALKGRLSHELVWEVYEVGSNHSCLNSGHTPRSVVNTQSWVRSTHQK